MLSHTVTQALCRTTYANTRSLLISRRLSHTTRFYAEDVKMPTGPPKHEMQYFPNIEKALSSESGNSRGGVLRVVQVPVGGKIGDKVCPIPHSKHI